jgi:hypothetical protein
MNSKTAFSCIVVIVLWLPLLACASQQMASLMDSADIVAVAEIGKTDYTKTLADGPMLAEATVLKSLKGSLRQGQSFSFSESAWVGPDYKTGEIRLLFLDSDNGVWRAVSNASVRPAFRVEREAIPLLNLQALRALLAKLPAGQTRTVVVITPEMLR